MIVRKYAKMVIASVLLMAPVLTAEAQNFPQRDITIVVPWAPGGFTDKLARILADKLSARLKKNVIVDNRSGASGQIGSEYVMRSAPDGHTLLLHSTDGTVKLLSTGKIDPLRDFTNIATLATLPLALSVGSQVPINSLEEFVKYAKEKPNGVSYASNGQGGAIHLGMEMFARQSGIRLLHVPYRGSPLAITDLLAGNVDSVLFSVQLLKPYFDAGKVKGLAVATPQRLASVPTIPTFAEAGCPEFQVRLWYALSGPKGIPDPIVNLLNKEVGEILALRQVQDDLTQSDGESLISSPKETSLFFEKEVARWSPIVKAFQ